jgi:hypothetical protein
MQLAEAKDSHVSDGMAAMRNPTAPIWIRTYIALAKSWDK